MQCYISIAIIHSIFSIACLDLVTKQKTQSNRMSCVNRAGPGHISCSANEQNIEMCLSPLRTAFLKEELSSSSAPAGRELLLCMSPPSAFWSVSCCCCCSFFFFFQMTFELFCAKCSELMLLRVSAH